MKEFITDFDQLQESMIKCQKNVTWKPSVKSFVLNSEENLHRMEEQLKNGTWKNGKPRPIQIRYPKKRDGLSIPFKDRIYQRSINDNSLYPQMTGRFIFPNAACQKGKGTDFTRTLIKKYMWNYFCNYGSEGGVIQIDIHGYYANMRHDKVAKCLEESVDRDTYEMSMDVLNSQYAGEIGYNPGSQMVQIAGISLLNKLDHFIKEQLHVKYYIRYMDDLWILWHDLEELQVWFEIIKENAIAYAVAIIDADTIDKINIYEASRLGMETALRNLNHKYDMVLTDYMPLLHEQVNVEAIAKGDAKSFNIACASILAKVTRDDLMIELDKKYPEYGFKKHKGYGTKQHLEALEKYGAIPHIHRQTYAPVSNLKCKQLTLF